MRGFPILCLLMTTLASLQAHAGDRTLDDTGMRRCVAADGSLSLHCRDTGQDGEFGRDAVDGGDKNGPLGFVFHKICNNGQRAGDAQCALDAPLGPAPADWACTLDRVTGLMWEVKTSDGGLRDYRTQYPFDDALRFAEDVNAAALCGHDDWRLPTRYELQSLAWIGRELLPLQPALDLTWFPNTESPYYFWTLSPSPARDHFIVFDGDGTVAANLQAGIDIAFVRLVRGASRKYTGRLVPAGDEVTDTAAHLAWKRCSEGQAWDGSQCQGEAGLYSWRAALDAGRQASRDAGVTWRLPNAKELDTLIVSDFDKRPPLIDGEMFPGTPTDAAFWSSTPSAQEDSVLSDSAYQVDFLAGYCGVDPQARALHVRLVRDL
jgi:hypothetical protein